MRRSLMLLMMLGVTGVALANPQAAAAGPPCAGHSRTMMQRMEQRRMERLTVLLELTPAQQARVKAILAEEHAKMRRSMRQVMRQMRATHRTVHQETLTRLSGVLSPEQMKKFKLLMPGRMLIMRHMGMGGMAVARPRAP